jgi:hypothetical protein
MHSVIIFSCVVLNTFLEVHAYNRTYLIYEDQFELSYHMLLYRHKHDVSVFLCWFRIVVMIMVLWDVMVVVW